MVYLSRLFYIIYFWSILLCYVHLLLLLLATTCHHAAVVYLYYIGNGKTLIMAQTLSHIHVDIIHKNYFVFSCVNNYTYISILPTATVLRNITKIIIIKTIHVLYGKKRFDVEVFDYLYVFINRRFIIIQRKYIFIGTSWWLI